jgi:hypothetical protein
MVLNGGQTNPRRIRASVRVAEYQLNEPNDLIEIRMKCENSKMLQDVPEAERLGLRPNSLDDERAL